MILNLDFVSLVPGYQKKIILLNFKPACFKHCFSDLWRSCSVFRRAIVFRKNNKKKSKQSTGGLDVFSMAEEDMISF